MTNKETGDFTEKRRSIRVPAPKKATAIFKNEKGSLDRVHIRDLSLGGMLISDNYEVEIYYKNSIISNIHLDIYVDDLDTGSKSHTFIGSGEVVRSFIDEASRTIYYGIEFINSSSNDKYQLKRLISKLTPSSYH